MKNLVKKLFTKEDLAAIAAAISEAEKTTARTAKATPTQPKALIFSPHPDDECIVGGNVAGGRKS